MEDVSRLVSTEDARRQLRVAGTVSADEAADIESKLAQATGIILAYLGSQADDTWDEATVPAPVHTAILLQLDYLYTYRGADLSDSQRDQLAPGVKAVLHATGRRDPVVA